MVSFFCESNHFTLNLFTALINTKGGIRTTNLVKKMLIASAPSVGLSRGPGLLKVILNLEPMLQKLFS
jgi:hypothetical protein